MIKEKFSKHQLILQRRINNQSTKNQIKKFENPTLNTVVTSLESAAGKPIDSEDEKAFTRIESYRKQLLTNDTLISYEAFDTNIKRTVQEICLSAASSKKWARALYYLVKYTEAPYCLEIGTNLGISGSYILEAIKNKKEGYFVTLEGLSALCDISKQQFLTIVDASKFDIKQGLYDQTFPELILENHQFNLLFIDGNHHKEPTLHYFNALKQHINSPAIFIFDDINWSLEMKETWRLIKQDPQVNYTIDLWQWGVVIIDSNDANKNEHFELHFAY